MLAPNLALHKVLIMTDLHLDLRPESGLMHTSLNEQNWEPDLRYGKGAFESQPRLVLSHACITSHSPFISKLLKLVPYSRLIGSRHATSCKLCAFMHT